MDGYELMARFYDLVNADLTEDLPFWLGLAAERGGPVLELGCGSGRVLLQLAREGLRAVGVDCSPAMLARARARLAQRADLGQRVTLIEQDVRRLALGEQFPLAIMPLNTFAHLLTFEDQHLALVRVAEHMAPGGWFALDVPNTAEVYGAPPGGLMLERTVRDESSGREVMEFSMLSLDRTAQLGHITWIYDEIDREGGVRRTRIPMTLRYTFPGEMRALLELSGLRLVGLYGGYQREPFEDGSPRMLVLAERPARG
jgi:SAM-dependent methyltransferase